MAREAKLDVDINPVLTSNFLRTSSQRDLNRRARKVATEARRLAPGSMKQKITTSTESGHVRVECSHPATLFVVRKTQPHAIRPNPPRVRLRFVKSGKIVFARKVWHPGNRRPNNFLAKALRAARR